MPFGVSGVQSVELSQVEPQLTDRSCLEEASSRDVWAIARHRRLSIPLNKKMNHGKRGTDGKESV